MAHKQRPGIRNEHDYHEADHGGSRVGHSSGLRSNSCLLTDASMYEGDYCAAEVEGTYIRGDNSAAWIPQSSVTLGTTHDNTPPNTPQAIPLGQQNKMVTSGSIDSKLVTGKGNISHPSWKDLKPVINDLYIRQNFSLQELMTYMRKVYKFQATKSQYERQFKMWGFRKNLTKSQWKDIAHRMSKRKLEGKESVVYLDNAVVPAKKIKKEAARYLRPLTNNTTHLRSSSPPLPDGVILTTPPASPRHSPSIISQRAPLPHSSLPSSLCFNKTKLPWFRYQPFLDSTIVSLSEFVVQKQTAEVKFTPTSGNVSMLDPISVDNFLWTMSKMFSEAKEFSVQLIPDEWPMPLQANLHAIYSYLQADIVEKQNDKHLTIVAKDFAFATENGTFLYLCLIIYLSSNNLISEEMTYQVVKWATDTNMHSFLKVMFSVKTPTAEAFAENMFCYSLYTDDLIIVCLALESGIDPNIRIGPRRLPPLQLAIKKRSLELVKILLDAGANLNDFAAISENMGVMEVDSKVVQSTRVLLEHDEAHTINPLTDCEKCPLHAAIESGNAEIVKLLLGARADVNYPAASIVCRTALQAAVKGGNIEIVKLLLKEGASMNSPAASSAGRTALQAGAETGNIEIVKLLLKEGADVNSPAASSAGRTALQAGAGTGNLEIVRLLLAAGANVKSPTAITAGRTALQAAVESGNLEVVCLLLAAGSNVNSPLVGSAGRTALQAAVETGNFELMRLFLETPDVVSILNRTSVETALQAAAIQGYVGIAYKILEAASVSRMRISIASWKTSLAGAAGNGRIDMVQLLCNFGLEIYGKTDGLFSEALQMAERNGHHAIFRLIQKHI